MKETFLLSTILGLLLLGLVIALRSGGSELTTTRGLKVLAANFSLLLLRVLGYVAGLLVLHKAIGAPSLPVW